MRRLPSFFEQEAIAAGKTEHPEMPLSETLAVAKLFDESTDRDA